MKGKGTDGAKKGTKDDRATNMLALMRARKAPEEVIEAAYDAMHYYMAACDLRRAAYQNSESGARLKAKAKQQARLGDKKFQIALDWLLAHPAPRPA